MARAAPRAAARPARCAQSAGSMSSGSSSSDQARAATPCSPNTLCVTPSRCSCAPPAPAAGPGRPRARRSARGRATSRRTVARRAAARRRRAVRPRRRSRGGSARRQQLSGLRAAAQRLRIEAAAGSGRVTGTSSLRRLNARRAAGPAWRGTPATQGGAGSMRPGRVAMPEEARQAPALRLVGVDREGLVVAPAGVRHVVAAAPSERCSQRSTMSKVSGAWLAMVGCSAEGGCQAR
jgi:hypothetical protein